MYINAMSSSDYSTAQQVTKLVLVGTLCSKLCRVHAVSDGIIRLQSLVLTQVTYGREILQALEHSPDIFLLAVISRCHPQDYSTANSNISGECSSACSISRP